MKILPVIGILILLAGAGVFFGVKINNISCKTQYGPCPPAIAGQLQKLKGQSIYSVNRSIGNFLKEKEGVDGYITQIKLPNDIEVTVQQSKPEFALHYKDNPATLLIDANGRVLGIEQSATLPQIISDRQPKDMGEQVTSEELFALNVVKDVYFTYNISQGSLEKDTLKMDLGSVFVWFPTQGEVDLQMVSLKLILAQIEAKPELSAQGKRTIDLRFKNPVIK